MLGESNQPKKIGFAQFSPTSGELRRGSFGVTSVTVNAGGQDWTIQLDPQSAGGLVNGDDVLAVGRVLSVGPGDGVRQLQQLAHDGSNGVRVIAINVIGELASTDRDVLVAFYRRVGE